MPGWRSEADPEDEEEVADEIAEEGAAVEEAEEDGLRSASKTVHSVICIP